jgi:NADP-dependent 3-hydroxy acid dehydrogenase YdfG
VQKKNIRIFMERKPRTVIIGGSSGMGLATAQKLYSIGHEIVIASRSKDKLEKAVKSIGKAESHVLDVTKENDIIQFFKSVGPFDHLVTSASAATSG